MPSCRQRYRRMRHTLIKFRSLVHIYVNRRRYLKVRWGCHIPGGATLLHVQWWVWRGYKWHPHTVTPPHATLPPPQCPIGYGHCPIGVKTLLILGRGQWQPTVPGCLRVSLPLLGLSLAALLAEEGGCSPAGRGGEGEDEAGKDVRHWWEHTCAARAAVPSSLPIPALLAAAPVSAGAGTSTASAPSLSCGGRS